MSAAIEPRSVAVPRRAPSPPAAVIFDCDGLLMDTEPCWTVAETALFARRGRPFTVKDKEAIIGRSLPDAGEILAELFGEAGRGAAIAQELGDLVATVVREEAQALPGAVELVARLRQTAIPIAVASNSPRSLLDSALARGGLTGQFAVTVAADEVPHPKPAPDLYLLACARLGVEPASAVALEDSATGVRSARAAGIYVIGVPTLATVALDADLNAESLFAVEVLRCCRLRP